MRKLLIQPLDPVSIPVFLLLILLVPRRHKDYSDKRKMTIPPPTKSRSIEILGDSF
jgi:hypothetical protein